LQTDAGANLLAAYKRASNILKKEEQKDKTQYDGNFIYANLQQNEEIKLVDAIAAAEVKVQKLLKDEKFAQAMQVVGELRPELDAFFAVVTVNADDAILRINRLNVLASIRNMLHQVADFSKLEG
jgi:glycyl-tRNA synthetase beta chain